MLVKIIKLSLLTRLFFVGFLVAKNNANLAVEALAGLASKEDFTAVTLKKSSDEPVGTLLPFRDLMLLQVKGRRHVQTRLLEPTASKVNQGDSYVLVTPNAVRYCNFKYLISMFTVAFDTCFENTHVKTD